MNDRRRLVVALGASVLTASLRSFAQQQGRVWRIGLLSSESLPGYQPRVDVFRAGLRDLGYVEGKNLVIEFRWAKGQNDRLPALAAELVRLNVDVLVTHATPPVQAAKQATTTIPIVMAASADPVVSGLVASLARPGGNVTGSTFFPTELAAKRIELLKEAFPRITQVAVLTDRGNPTMGPSLKAMETTARLVKVTLHEFAVRGPHEFDNAFAAMVKKQVGAVAVPDSPIFLADPKGIAILAERHQIPSVGNKEFAEAGGVIGYGANLLDLWRRAAYFVDKIFKGAKPIDLPIEQPTIFELVINTRTTAALGIKIAQSLLLRADKLIE